MAKPGLEREAGHSIGPGAVSGSDRLFREVILLSILTHHAVGSELRHQSRQSATNPLNPLSRASALVTIVEHRHHFLGQDLVYVGAVGAILFLHRIRMSIFSDGESV